MPLNINSRNFIQIPLGLVYAISAQARPDKALKMHVESTSKALKSKINPAIVEWNGAVCRNYTSSSTESGRQSEMKDLRMATPHNVQDTLTKHVGIFFSIFAHEGDSYSCVFRFRYSERIRMFQRETGRHASPTSCSLTASTPWRRAIQCHSYLPSIQRSSGSVMCNLLTITTRPLCKRWFQYFTAREPRFGPDITIGIDFVSRTTLLATTSNQSIKIIWQPRFHASLSDLYHTAKQLVEQVLERVGGSVIWMSQWDRKGAYHDRERRGCECAGWIIWNVFQAASWELTWMRKVENMGTRCRRVANGSWSCCLNMGLAKDLEYSLKCSICNVHYLQISTEYAFMYRYILSVLQHIRVMNMSPDTGSYIQRSDEHWQWAPKPIIIGSAVLESHFQLCVHYFISVATQIETTKDNSRIWSLPPLGLSSTYILSMLRIYVVCT